MVRCHIIFVPHVYGTSSSSSKYAWVGVGTLHLVPSPLMHFFIVLGSYNQKEQDSGAQKKDVEIAQ